MSSKSIHGHSEACCSVPPVVASGYEPKGKYETVDGLRAYTVGPDDATKGVVYVPDIFGFTDQTIQGVDIVSASNTHGPYKVVAPDFFNGSPAELFIFPPDTPERQEKLTNFLTLNPPGGTAPKLPGLVKALNAKHPSVQSWGILGFCWGGKVVSLTVSKDDNPFVVGGECHPAMVDPKEAAGIKVPIIMLASNGEPEEDVKAFEKALTVPNHVEIYADQAHGWMAARANLTDKHHLEGYIRGYASVGSFFAKYL